MLITHALSVSDTRPPPDTTRLEGALGPISAAADLFLRPDTPNTRLGKLSVNRPDTGMRQAACQGPYNHNTPK